MQKDQDGSIGRGFNVIGPVDSPSEEGEYARSVLRGLSDSGYPFRYLNVRKRAEAVVPFDLPGRHTDLSGAMPYRANLFLLDPEWIFRLIIGNPFFLDTQGKTNICAPLWKGFEVPEDWRHILRKMNAVLVPGPEFISRIENISESINVFQYRPSYGTSEVTASWQRSDRAKARCRFGLPPEEIVFLAEIEVNGSRAEPDPIPILHAFNRSYPDGRGACLALRLIGSGDAERVKKISGPLKDLSNQFPAIRILEGDFSVDQVSEIRACCNCHVNEALERKDVVFNEDWMKRLAEDPSMRTGLKKGNVFGSLLELRLKNPGRNGASGHPRVLFQNRSSAFWNPGGDTIVMERLEQELEQLGARVDFSPSANADLSDYDIVHLFNCTLPDIIEPYARNAAGQGKPFVIQAFQEMFSQYAIQCKAYAKILEAYVNKGQPPGLLRELLNLIRDLPPEKDVTSPFAAANAAAVFSCGESETKSILTLNPLAKVVETRYGSVVKPSSVGPELFIKHFGVRDFVLCVGRLEGRKNQLMLLAALEHSELPLVFADGGFTGDPSYARLCRVFKRRGQTVFTGRLSDEMLISAYRAAKVHCLPSWYELPGLVTLEAANYGCFTVASSWGSIRDYMGNASRYCSPDDVDGIRAAIEAACIGNGQDGINKFVPSLTWQAMGQNVMNHYLDILGSN